MENGTPTRKQYESQGSWTPAIPFRPILSKRVPIYVNGETSQPNQATCQGSESDCFSSVCSQYPPSNSTFICFNSGNCVNMSSHVTNGEVSSTGQISINCNNVEGRRESTMDPLAKWKNVPFASLLALANAPYPSDRAPTDEVSASHHHSYDLNFHPGAMQKVASDITASEFAPITLDKTMRVKAKQFSKLANLCADDRTKHGRDEQDKEIAQERIDSNGTQHNKQLLELVTDASVSTVSAQIKENPNSEKGGNHGVDLNKTPQQKPRRIKHRPKVVKAGNDGTSRTAGSKGNPTVKRKYVRKKGLDKDLESYRAEEARESINLKTPEPTMELCRKNRNFDIGLTRDENSSMQICEGSEVITPKPSGPKANPAKKRKYVRSKGLDKEVSPSTEPTKESCMPFNFDVKEQLRDENSTGKSTFDLILESQAKDFCPSKLTVQLVKEIEARSPKSVTPLAKEYQTGKRKYVRKKALNKDSTSTPVEAAVESNDLKKLKPAKKSCRRTLNFDIEGQPRDENSMSKSSVDLDSGSQRKKIYGAGTQSKSIVQLGEGIEVIVENTQAGIIYDLTHSVNRLKKDYVLSPEGQAPTTPLPTKTDPHRQKQNTDSRKENKAECLGQENVDNGEGNAKEIVLQIDSQLLPKSLNDYKCSTFSISIEQRQAWGLKRNYSGAIKQAETGRSNLIGIHYHTLRTCQIPGPHFPNIYKKKRTEKGPNSSTSCTSSSVTALKNITLESTCFQGKARADYMASGTQEGQKTLEGILALSPVERPTKKRSRGLTRVRDLASLTRIADCTMQQTHPGTQGPLDCDKHPVENPQRPQTCIETLLAEMHEMLVRKKRTKKRNTPLRSTSPNTNGVKKQQKIILNNHNLFSSNSLGTLSELEWKQTLYIDTIIEQLKDLNINRETSCIKYQELNALLPYYMVNQEHNALVLYSRDSRLVPFQGPFDLIKTLHPRPKVELDEETNRVWKLLMQNINSEGVDGTDEENAKWWEEERRVFHGRVDSFIARMHLVQGDRRFSKWKGSVVDSVVGVFLTQNVSDHLSSSAFMSLAANFPLKSKKQKPNVEETSSVVNVPVVYLLDPEDTIEQKGKTSHQPVHDQSSLTLHASEHNEEKEVVSSNDSLENSTYSVSYINESKSKLMNACESSPETYDYVVSSQNSMDSSIAQHADRTRSSSNSSSADAGILTKHNSFNDSGSFAELFQMVGSTMLHEVFVHRKVNMPFNENSKDDHKQFCTMKYDNQSEKAEDLDGPKEFLRVSGIPPSSFEPCLTKDLALEVEGYEMLVEETKSSGISENNDKNTVTDQITLTPEFAKQTTDAIRLTVPGLEAPRCQIKQSSNMMQEDKNITAQHQSELFGDSRFAMGSLAHAQKSEMNQHLYFKKLPKATTDAVESRIAFDDQENTRQKTSESHWNKHDNSFSKELNEINDATSKQKGRRAGKEKQNDFDWDSLRRQVEANGRKKERPENTLDSLDWGAVRHADVNKIANTIKERGMNNVLAERIKDFLNRLVRDHRSIDLEWLREVPPDKAKEYLLSIRGLGLKSVECVRLLTLHHLAFPVDTNVGRIAVRLGWVPLQPLPESLQLHLLELYPVLESIQKYLWPRLCKLDQRTLYELHYQMITFGKVFCTKSKPNCNACPMRGECRHFASAFASSRLALPGPEEKAIVHAKENRTTHQTPVVMMNQTPLPLPQATELLVEHHQSEAETVLNTCEPIIEEPATPEPECIQVSENDIEDAFCEDPDEIPTIKLNMKEFTKTLQNYMQDNLELQEGDMSKALVALTAEAASIPTPKLKNVSRLRTEHQVYELPDSHPLLEGLDKREPDDPGRYMLAIWTPGETTNSIQPPERSCSSREHGKLCDEKTCFSCNSVRESESQIVRGTLLIPCRTAMRGSFPLNGTYFQVNEVFADHDSSLKPINVPREWIWNLPRRTVYFGTSIPTLFKGLTTEGIQHCFWRGYVCVRGFDHKTRAPRPLIARLHFPASKLNKAPGKTDVEDK